MRTMKMKWAVIHPALLILFGSPVFLLLETEGAAQLFGSRSIRRTMTRQNSSSVGMVRGNERYVRGSRRDSFVGANQGELSGFVGNQQARTSGRIASPTGGLKKFADRSGQINRPVPSLKKGQPYPPVIVLPSEMLRPVLPSQSNRPVSNRLTTELKKKVSGNVSVSVANRTARLQGEVESESQKVLAELLIRFEPGIDEVQNELEVSGN